MKLDLRKVILCTLVLVSLAMMALICIKWVQLHKLQKQHDSVNIYQTRRERAVAKSLGDYSFDDLTTLIDAIELELDEQAPNTRLSQTLKRCHTNLSKFEDVIVNMQVNLKKIHDDEIKHLSWTHERELVLRIQKERDTQNLIWAGRLSQEQKTNKNLTAKIELMNASTINKN